jgi:uncharacterized membrane protein
MKPLLVLVITFAVSLLVVKAIRKEYKVALSARIALSVMLLFTSIGHFLYTEGMTMMLPDFIPFKKETVYFTGIIEILAAIGLQIARVRVLTAWLLILFFVLILPANIHAAIKGVDYETGTLQGTGTNYLWFRVPLQLFFIVWTYLSAIKFEHRGRNVSQ